MWLARLIIISYSKKKLTAKKSAPKEKQANVYTYNRIPRARLFIEQRTRPPHNGIKGIVKNDHKSGKFAVYSQRVLTPAQILCL